MKKESASGLVFTLTNKMAIYDPRAGTWSNVNPPPGWGFIGDSPWTLLADGRLLLGQKLTKRAAVLNLKTMTWTEVSTIGKHDINAEEGWTLLPDGSVLTVDVKSHPHAERFIPDADPTLTRWVAAGETPANLQSADPNADKAISFNNGTMTYDPPGEIGPAILRPDGTVFVTGAVCAASGPSTDPNACQVVTKVGHTAIFDLGFGGAAAAGSGPWRAGPDFPNGEGAGDSFASLLPNGHVLVETNPAGTANDPQARYARIAGRAIHPVVSKEAQSTSLSASTPTWRFYEFDGVRLIPEPAASFVGGQASMLLLPTGEVMLNGQAVYKSSGAFQNPWRPTIEAAPTEVTAGGTYVISGTQFNGLSQANAFGDEFQAATNYPLVRITNDSTGHVTYAFTHNVTATGVATGSTIVFAAFDVPQAIEPGNSKLEVVANGIPSHPWYLTVGAQAASR